MPSGIRLQQLIQNQHKEILAREKNNDKFIHLYDIGAYWAAFERSACRLSGLFSENELTLFCVPDCVEYVVMASVPADEAESYFREYIILHDGIYRKVWSEHSLLMGDYRHWHETAVRSVLLQRKVCGLRGPSKWCYFAWEHILLCLRRYLTFFQWNMVIRHAL